jgi:hypothetical protein
LIAILARQAGVPSARLSLSERLTIAAGLSLALSAGLVALWSGVLFKLAGTLALAAGGIILAWRAALPGNARPTLATLLPGLSLMAFRALTDSSGLSITGNSGVSPYACVSSILLVSLPPLAITLAALRSGAPVRPWLAGLAAGVTSGALGAAAYALACRNDGGAFVALWYPLAIFIVGGLGALVGRRVLAW